MSCNYILLVVISISQSLPNVILQTTDDISTLKLLQVVHRHGDRTPTKFFPNDPFQNPSQYWYEGVGQLTNEGKYRMYRIGQYIRQHYHSFLGNEFSPLEVFARSSAADRCLASASLLLSGAYPPNNTRWQWSEDNNTLLATVWQPFPIESVIPLEDDRLLEFESNCPTADSEFKKSLESKEVKKFLNSYQPFIRQLKTYIGRKFHNILDMSDFRDTLVIENYRGYKWSDRGIWSKSFEKTIMNNLAEINSFFMKLRYSKVLNELRAGPLINELSTNFEDIIRRNITKKLMLYSTHDSNLEIVMKTLDIFNDQPVPYGSTLFFELHRKPQTDYHFVRIYYFNETLPPIRPHLLRLPKCDYLADCPVDRFFTISEQFVPKNWNIECRRSGYQPIARTFSSQYMIFITTNFVLFILMIIILVIVKRKHKKEKQYFYQNFNNQDDI